MVLHLLTILLVFFQSLFVTETAPSRTVTSHSVPWATTTGIVSHIVDGDTIDVRQSDGQTVRIRYIGINTPEARPYPECGSASSTARNRELVDGKLVTLIPGPGFYDIYGRRLAYVYVGDIFVNRELLAEGWAELMMVPPNIAYQASFEIVQAAARSKGGGIWSCPGR